ncbi:septum site-determining protein MinC [Desulforamulus profundi]|uniref:Septum site-determining protein MinC n=2 Tax=Desulforamulus profundi TaxID=1383067 RepID=A0A2C6MB92_9FIRM|nr:septum site-determining protein MinC [Desulforamulus profundi]PHJ36765.1 septum site-determining protein MinC [Desulforamulus profundi]
MTKETLSNSTTSHPSLGSFPVELAELVDENTILVQRTLRSGQSICHDGNVVVLGDVNPGAEVVASGNIIVMGSLRGVVHAGVKGDTNAIILAFRLRPTQLRIGNHITRPPEDESSDPDYPELARIKNGVVTIETFNSVIK